MSKNDLDVFTQAYVKTLLWQSTDIEDDLDWDDIDESGQKEIIEDCKDFQESFGHLFQGREEQAGHDFALTRNRHGAGFWDGDWPEHGDELTKMSHPYGSQSCMMGDDGKLFLD